MEGENNLEQNSVGEFYKKKKRPVDCVKKRVKSY